MADDVIRNPLRSVPRVKTPYEPEHVRLNVNVQPAPGAGQIPVQEDSKFTPSTVKNDEVWISVDNDAFDENGAAIPFDNGHIIDNNDYVNLGFDSMLPVHAHTQKEVQEDAATPQVGDYILMVLGKLITSGTIDKIQSKVKSIMYGDDAAFSGVEISLDDIVVLKRMNIKVGIFIDG